MTKVSIKSESIMPFGGIFYVTEPWQGSIYCTDKEETQKQETHRENQIDTNTLSSSRFSNIS
jgi:hypothetical protein